MQSDDTKFLTPIAHPELIFGLVAPIGTDLSSVTSVLESHLRGVGYEVYHIHVTDALKEISLDLGLQDHPIEKRYETYIAAGNKVRETLGRDDALALFSISAIGTIRFQKTGDSKQVLYRTAYILNQFKRTEEVDTLRRVYGKLFIQISCFSPKDHRINLLTKKIFEGNNRDKREDFYKSIALSLISTDEEEEGNSHGQRVRDTYPLADAIIDATSEDSTHKSCRRLIHALFGDNFITPSKDEYGIYAARMVALRSSDLSRQVGAVAMTSNGDLISVGCNEVPKAGGGAYWEDDPNDHRDFQVGYDSSAKFKKIIVQDTINKLRNAGWINPFFQSWNVDELANQALNGPLNKSHLSNILEFGRIIHAEMAAITDAARLGRTLKDATLYVTTFPCHICARHIIASGINRVVYLEPYSKSAAIELYEDSILLDTTSHSHNHAASSVKIPFEQFIGVGPTRYSDLFSKGKRKDGNGNAVKWDAKKAHPIVEKLLNDYTVIETGAKSALDQLLRERNLIAD